MTDAGMIATSKPNHAKNGGEPSSFEDQIGRLRDDLSALSKTVADIGAKGVEKTGSDLAKTSKDALETVRDEVASLESGVKDRIRDNPLQAVGIAAGIGFIAALLARH